MNMCEESGAVNKKDGVEGASHGKWRDQWRFLRKDYTESRVHNNCLMFSCTAIKCIDRTLPEWSPQIRCSLGMMSLTRSRGHVCLVTYIFRRYENRAPSSWRVSRVCSCTSSIHDHGGSDCLCTLTRTVLLDAGRKRENHNDRARSFRIRCLWESRRASFHLAGNLCLHDTN